jgi:menaquinone-9 beta-reductase
MSEPSLLEKVQAPGWQLPVDADLPTTWDVIVVGAGPAGSLAAGRLASLGHRVLLLDKAGFPRDKTCGDALIPDSLKALHRAGLLADIKSLGHCMSDGSVFSPSQTEVSVPGEYVTLKRRILDAVMAYRAVGSGAVFRQGTVRGIRTEPDGSSRVELNSAAVFTTRITVLATGADVSLSSQLGALKRQAPSAVAVRCYVTSSAQIDRLIISYDRSITPGYAWIFPLGHDEYNIGCGVFYRASRHREINLREMFSRFLVEFPLARQLVKHQRAITPLRGAPLRCSLTGTQVLSGGNVVAIGETIGATYPLTGEGIGKAMETAELAADAIHATLRTGSSRPLRILPWKIRTELLPRYLGYEIGERWLSYPWLNDFIAWRVQRSALLQRLIKGIIAETVDPRHLFSFGGLLKSLWK